MSLPVATPNLSAPHRQALQRAVLRLENPDFAARLAEHAGQPLHRMLRLMPKAASKRLQAAVEVAILKCLNIAITSIEPQSNKRPANRASSVMVGLSGGVSGFFGFAALPIELPVTTTLMLRSIADIARHYGEDLSSLEARLACVEVFALGAPKQGPRTDLGYYASRALLSRLASEASSVFVERGVATATTPVVTNLIAEIATRFGIVVSERAAASALPVLGALGGATVNVVFMNHFQRIAEGHFTVRRLERQYGSTEVRHLYEDLARPQPSARIG